MVNPLVGIDRTGIAVAEGESGGLFSADCRCQIHRRIDIFHTVEVATTTSHMRAVCQHIHVIQLSADNY